MKRRHLFIIAGALGLAIIATVFGLWGNPLSSEPPKTVEQKFDEQVQQAIGRVNRPLRFWGKVVDQNGNPLAGVEVSYKARKAIAPMLGMLGTKDSYGKTLSNADGSFYLDAGKGDMLGLYGFAKAGHRLAENMRTGFPYAGSSKIHRPTPERPVLFVMFEEGAIEPLHHIRRLFDLRGDGSPLTIDLVAGEPSQSGQLRMSFQRDPLHIQRGRRFQWSARIEVVGGGLQKANAEGAFIAPEEGYVSAIDYDFSPKDPDWDRGLREQFYFKTADGKYGRIELKLHADSEPPPVTLLIESWLNPLGSRNLEPGRTTPAPAPTLR